MSTTTFKHAKRVQTSLLAPIEKPALQWLAQRIPDKINSDHLTILGLVATFAAGVFYYLSHWNPMYLHLVNLSLAVNWFGDSLDGTVARYRNQQRPKYGFYVDHIVDAFSTVFIVTGIILSGYMNIYIALIFLVIYLIMSINVYLATYTIGTFSISFWKLSPTEARIMLALGNLILLYYPTFNIFGQTYRLPDAGGILLIGVLSIMLMVSVIQNTTLLYRQEKI